MKLDFTLRERKDPILGSTVSVGLKSATTSPGRVKHITGALLRKPVPVSRGCVLSLAVEGERPLDVILPSALAGAFAHSQPSGQVMTVSGDMPKGDARFRAVHVGPPRALTATWQVADLLVADDEPRTLVGWRSRRKRGGSHGELVAHPADSGQVLLLDPAARQRALVSNVAALKRVLDGYVAQGGYAAFRLDGRAIATLVAQLPR